MTFIIEIYLWEFYFTHEKHEIYEIIFVSFSVFCG